jgi:hypothetical protein
VLLAYNQGTPVLCVVNLAGGNNLDETGFITPTTISVGATSANTIYSASAVAANSPYRVIGVVVSTQATAGTWATAPSLVQGAGGEALSSLQSAGVGKLWQSVIGSRVSGTTYTNDTMRPITVSVTAEATTAGVIYLTATINSVAAVFNAPYVPGGGYYASVVFPVPPGQSYSVTASSTATPTITTWAELR